MIPTVADVIICREVRYKFLFDVGVHSGKSMPGRSAGHLSEGLSSTVTKVSVSPSYIPAHLLLGEHLVRECVSGRKLLASFHINQEFP